jgi:EAL domain-containing protein (putative c-di-GMP-specific phosphodiesterase class I)
MLRHHVPNDMIEVEITESTAVEDMTHTIQQMDALTHAGIALAMDDFGTGYSSLNALKRFPIKKLKIDKSFIDDMLENQDDAAIVETIISLSQTLKMMNIAEGVETQEQLDCLKQKGCEAIQGYLFSRPLPADDFMAFYTQHQKQLVTH